MIRSVHKGKHDGRDEHKEGIDSRTEDGISCFGYFSLSGAFFLGYYIAIMEVYMLVLHKSDQRNGLLCGFSSWKRGRGLLARVLECARKKKHAKRNRQTNDLRTLYENWRGESAESLRHALRYNDIILCPNIVSSPIIPIITPRTIARGDSFGVMR